MPHVVTDKCTGCKFTDCVEVCPVACFYDEEQDLPPEFAKDVEFNAVQAKQLKDSGAPAITARKDPLPGAAERKKALGY